MWKDIIGYEGLYKINEFGDVISLRSGSLLSYYISNKGYKIVDLAKNGIRTHFLVHRLVAIHFIPNPNNYPIVLHKDNIKLNTHYSNLKWGTFLENNIQAINDGIRVAFGSRFGTRPANIKEYEIYNDYQRIFCNGYKEIIDKIGYGDKTLIRNTLHRKTELKEGQYKGYKLSEKRILKAIVESPIYYLTDVQRSALDEGGFVP